MGRQGGSQYIVLASYCSEEHTLIHEVYFVFATQWYITSYFKDFTCPWPNVPTPIITNMTTGQIIGVNREMSLLDIQKLNELYPCIKPIVPTVPITVHPTVPTTCLLYTSDAADE